jgi:hypothetical protein
MKPREVAELLDVPMSTVLEWGRSHVRFIRTHVEAAILGAEHETP